VGYLEGGLEEDRDGIVEIARTWSVMISFHDDDVLVATVFVEDLLTTRQSCQEGDESEEERGGV
jgi:hypothetical protein